MPPMPYALEVGPVFSLLNDYVEDRRRVVTLLKELRDPNKHVGDLTVFRSTSGQQLPQTNGMTAADHIERHWFGFPQGSHTQPGFNRANPVGTGWWKGWYGDAEGITRETMRRGCEVALGVAHAAEEIQPTRDWRLQFMWTCATPYFQGWVSWIDGVVTVTFTTPGNGHPLYATPYRPASMAPAPNYEAPATTVGEYGLWVVGEAQTEIQPRKHKPWQPQGTGFLPDWPGFVHTSGGVVVVAPAEEDGGMLVAGREYVP